MGLITWMILGLTAGLLANLIDPAPAKGGFLGSLFLGLCGAMGGGIFTSVIFGKGLTGFDPRSVAIATLGALFFLSIQKFVLRDAKHIRTRLQ